MTLINKKLVDGKKVGFYDFEAPLIDHCLKQAVRIMEFEKFDEYRFSINGVNFILNGSETFEELKKHFHDGINIKHRQS